jgi:hypothetical protein
MVKRRVILEWDDSPNLVDTANYLMEVVAVSPFKKPSRFGWILTLRFVNKPEKTLQDWLTVQTEDSALAWQVERTQKFLQHAGLAGSDTKPTEITHKQLVGVVVTAFVKKEVSKKNGEYINRIKSYLPTDSAAAIDEKF